MDFGDPSEALRYLRHSQIPRLIVLDLMMPEMPMDGWDFRHEQRRDPKLAQIPVIAISAAGKLMDADVSLRKPIQYKELLRAVRQFLTSAEGKGA
jgi:CheY-like chemotaxis protein